MSWRRSPRSTYLKVWRCEPARSAPALKESAARRDLTVDSIVAATAVELAPSVVITADKPDLELLVDGFDVKVLSI
ncbi:MAG: hypothetical protein WAW88_02575 [Nocardioides sp.]